MRYVSKPLEQIRRGWNNPFSSLIPLMSLGVAVPVAFVNAAQITSYSAEGYNDPMAKSLIYGTVAALPVILVAGKIIASYLLGSLEE